MKKKKKKEKKLRQVTSALAPMNFYTLKNIDLQNNVDVTINIFILFISLLLLLCTHSSMLDIRSSVYFNNNKVQKKK